MLERIVSFFKTGPDIAVIAKSESDAHERDRRYRRMRLSVFLSVTIGYGFFYVSRINFSVIKKPLLDAGVLSATEMGFVGSALLLVYSFGKLVNGFLADYCNIARFISTALLVCAVLNLLPGFGGGFAVFVVLWGFNGWFQSIGAAPSVVAISHWFSRSERGTRYGVWSVSHSIGEAITFACTTALVSACGWRWGFWGPGLVCAVVALVLFNTLADRPETYGFAPVDEGEAPTAARTEDAPKAPATPATAPAAFTTKLATPATAPAQTRGIGQTVENMQPTALKTPGVWVLALASGCMYVARYGVGHWGPLFLQTAKGYSLVASGAILAVYPITQMLGSASSGYVSDRFFGSKHEVPALIYGLLMIVSLAVLYALPLGYRLGDTAALAAFGFGLGGLLVYLGGLMAIDIVPRRATGAAMGIVGLFSYFVAAIQDTLSGYLVDASRTVVADGVTTYSFGQVFVLWIGAAILSLVLVISLRFFKKSENQATV